MPVGPRLERRLRAITGDRPLAVVLGGGSGGLSYARSLGPRGIPILLVESPVGSAGRSHYVWSVALPGVLQHEGEWIELLDRVGSWLATPGVLLPTNDVATSFIARHADHLAASFHFVVPDAEVVQSIVDKRTQYEHAQAAGIPIPVTYFPESAAEAERVAASVRYPCIFKPHESALGRVAMRSAPERAGTRAKALVVSDKEDLVACFKRFATNEIRFMVQEIVPGDDRSLFGYWGFWDAEGRERAWMTKQKVRQFPLEIGSGSAIVSVFNPEVADLSRDLLRSFGFRGLANIEFKLDARDGTYRLIEINPRSSNANQLAVSAGVDFPFLVYRYLTRPDEQGGPNAGFRPGVTWIHEDLDLQAFLALRRTGDLTFAEWVRSLVGTRSWAVASVRDPAPFLFQVYTQLAGRVGKTLRSSRSRRAP